MIDDSTGIEDAAGIDDGDQDPPHFKSNERRRAHRASAIPPNPNADTAYGPVRGSDPAHPQSSSTAGQESR
jgi:hypothetical protein